MKIAIVGMGVAGISVLREWTRRQETNSSIDITVFGDEPTFGTGVPYQKDNENLLMNVPAEFTTIVPEKKYDFVEWLKQTQGEENPRFGYYSRQLFGEYLTDRMNTWLIQSKADVVKEKVDTIRILSNNHFRLTFNTGEKDFDVVHLCMGDLPYKDHYRLKDHPNFVINPFPVREKLSSIPLEARVGVLGTGLTSVDIFRYFHYHRPDLNLSFFSHSGRFKSVSSETKKIDFLYFTKENIEKTKKINSGFIPLETYIDWFKKEIKHKELFLKKNWSNTSFGSKDTIKKELKEYDNISTIQAMLIDMNPLLTDLWMSLTDTDKHIFLEKYYGRWGKLRSTFPAASGEILSSAWEEQSINVFDGLMDVLIGKDKKFKLILKNQESYKVDFLINAAGAIKNVSYDMEEMPLLSQLLNERILQPESFGGVQVTVPNLSAISQKYGVLNNFKVHGSLISGIQFGNNSVDIISESVQASVQSIANKKNIEIIENK